MPASATSGIPFDVVGQKSAVKNAILMLKYHLGHLKDVESTLQGRRGHSSDGGRSQTVKVGGGVGEVVPRGGGGQRRG